MNQQQKLAAALMKAGITNPAAWDAAGVEYPGAGGTAVATSAAGGGTAVADPASAFDLNPKTVLMKGENNRTFFISWRSQRDLAQSLGREIKTHDLGRSGSDPVVALLAPGPFWMDVSEQTPPGSRPASISLLTCPPPASADLLH